MMKKFGCLLLGLSFVLMLLRAPAAAPPNDLFANRIVLSGNSLCFTSSVVGATRELNESWYQGDSGAVFGPTIWWTWTAPEALPVTVVVERLNLVPGLVDGSLQDKFTVWRPSTSVTNFPTWEGWVADLPLLYLNPIASMTFTSALGATYLIQQAGYSTNDFRVCIVATNLPLVLEQPRSVVVAAGSTALLWVMAAGARPFGYQWRFNDVNLPGDTAPMLGLTNVSPAHAGNYSVVVSNFAGTVISDAAFLGVNAQTSPARLQSLSKTTNRVEFQVQGEPGNYYRIESSTNLAQWLPEMSFKDSRPFYSRYFTTSLIFASNMLSTITVPSLDPRKYYRAALYAPSNEVCNLNLKEIRLAKDMWARERKHSSTEYASVTELQVYLPQKAIPGCPTAGFYIFETVGRTPTCSSPGHILEEAW